ncbi:MAG: F0F1 ATP synthase subunit delta [Proteobacteria bacterium]|nr:F0F1 ATP synthase subunit delta [Pseudomonadota bacterium]
MNHGSTTFIIRFASGYIVKGIVVSETSSTLTGIAKRYATAVFELCKYQKNLDTLESNVDLIGSLIMDSEDFRTFLASPLLTREDQSKAIREISKKLKLSKVMSNFLSLIAIKRRLFILNYFVKEIRLLISIEKGEVTAEVTTARGLTDEQNEEIVKMLSHSTRKKVKLLSIIDNALIGGLIVKVGSKMLDTSIRAKLISLQSTMKEVS